MIRARSLPAVVFGAASLAFGVAFVAVRPPRDGGRVTLDPSTWRLDRAEAAHHYDLAMRVRNQTGRAVHILGGSESCGPAGCITFPGLPLTVPAGGTGTVAVHYQTAGVGPVLKEADLYTDCPSQPKLPVRVVGSVEVAASGPGAVSAAMGPLP